MKRIVLGFRRAIAFLYLPIFRFFPKLNQGTLQEMIPLKNPLFLKIWDIKNDLPS